MVYNMLESQQKKEKNQSIKNTLEKQGTNQPPHLDDQ